MSQTHDPISKESIQRAMAFMPFLKQNEDRDEIVRALAKSFDRLIEDTKQEYLKALGNARLLLWKYGLESDNWTEEEDKIYVEIKNILNLQ